MSRWPMYEARDEATGEVLTVYADNLERARSAFMHGAAGFDRAAVLIGPDGEQIMRFLGPQSLGRKRRDGR